MHDENDDDILVFTVSMHDDLRPEFERWLARRHLKVARLRHGEYIVVPEPSLVRR